MSRDWSAVRVLSTMKEVRSYLAERYQIRLSRSTLYEYASDEFLPLPLHPPGRADAGKGTRGIIETEVIDGWVAARFHLRAASPPAPATSRSSP